jgi:CDP-2,3-bis-(O-geranylgeranyl)-sn-glycerol synthase
MELFKELFFALWFFLPAAIANMMPIFAARWKFIATYDYPMDFHKSFRGQRVFGDHKTIRGLIVGIICSTLVLWLQQLAVTHIHFVAELTDQVDYSQLPVLALGPLFGLGALLGDAIESFFKRQRGVKPGDGWFPFDQTDYIIGGAIATMPFVQLSVLQYVWLIVLWLVIHVIATTIGYKLGLKDKPI